MVHDSAAGRRWCGNILFTQYADYVDAASSINELDKQIAWSDQKNKSKKEKRTGTFAFIDPDLCACLKDCCSFSLFGSVWIQTWRCSIWVNGALARTFALDAPARRQLLWQQLSETRKTRPSNLRLFPGRCHCRPNWIAALKVSK